MKAARQPVQENPDTELPVLSRKDLFILKERLRRKSGDWTGTADDTEEGKVTLFRNVPFLLAFSLTIMNAFLYVYLAANDFPALDQRNADALIREAFGRDYTYFSPIYEFLGATRTTEESAELGFPEFKKSLGKLTEDINSFGISTKGIFPRQSFHFSAGGIYWSPPLIEGGTFWKPSARQRVPSS